MKFKEYMVETIDYQKEETKMIDMIKKIAVEKMIADRKRHGYGDKELMREEAADLAYNIVEKLSSKILALHGKDFEDLVL